jgi:hypothetical protein
VFVDPGSVSATDRHVEFLPLPETPGYAHLIGGSHAPNSSLVPIDEAELFKINDDRRAHGLEEMHQMPPAGYLARKLCRRCGGPARLRCSACRTSYCSKSCQGRSWANHVFVCRAPGRPNDVDFLRLALCRVMTEIMSRDEERMNGALPYLLADDHVCRTFGFNNCEDSTGVLNLLCLYGVALAAAGRTVATMQRHVEDDSLGNWLERFCQLHRAAAQVANTDEAPWVTWFLERRSSPTASFPIPNRDKATYEIWDTAWRATMRLFDLASRFAGGWTPSEAQWDIVDLYVAIQPAVGQLPDVYCAAWTKFGFCYCKSHSQRAALARRYLELAFSAATFDDIVSAYETASLADLMRAHGIDVSDLETRGTSWLSAPSPCEYSVHRLMIGVEHALSGRFCPCFRVAQSRRCHARFESHLDDEAGAHFGFHVTGSWERWQLLNFYKHVFRLPGFEVRDMAGAICAEGAGREGLQEYLDMLVPGMRGKIFDPHRATLAFPRLGDRLRARTEDGRVVPHHHLPCKCRVHDVLGPPGISHLSSAQVLALTTE